MNGILPPALQLRLPTGVDLDFRWIPEGEFRRGGRGVCPDEEPVHQVRLTHSFYLGRFPVTQAQYAAFHPRHRNGFLDDLRRPVEQVSWYDAVEFCAWLNDRSKVAWPSGLDAFTAQLPSEAQWEYACRGGTETEYSTGDGAFALSAAGWYVGNSDGETRPVGLKEPNAFGLYDMHGNVWEWCGDRWDENAYKTCIDGICDPLDPLICIGEDKILRVVRGGSWSHWAGDCRAASRLGNWPENRDRFRGFRVCLFPGPCRFHSSEIDAVE